MQPNAGRKIITSLLFVASMRPYIDIAEKAKTDAMDAMEKALGE